MKQFLKKISVFCLLALSLNLLIGIARLQVEDEIPYRVNKREAFVTANQFNGRCDTAVYVTSRTDLGHDSLNLPKGVLRICDAYGFSNAQANSNPDILFIGDSFFDDPHLNTSEGLQAMCNKQLHRNAAYNIGANGCSGFAVYNELRAKAFLNKPKIIFFETVERAMNTHILGAAKQLKSGEFKSIQHHYYGLDLLLGANCKDLSASKLFFDKEDKKYGYIKKVDGKEIWFLRNRLSVFAELKSIVAAMLRMRNTLAQQNIKLVFVIAPDKESLYPKIFGTSKIELLYELMQQSELECIDMYTAMMANPNDYYFATDTHWNGKAIALLADKAADYYQKELGK